MKINLSDFLILIAVGLFLLLCDRIFRINRYIDNFENPSRCGVNGFCVSDSVPILKPTMLPVFP